MKKQTFVIDIIDQQNASWQGSVQWINTGKKENFRSALELLRLIDSALAEEKKNSDGEEKEDWCAALAEYVFQSNENF